MTRPALALLVVAAAGCRTAPFDELGGAGPALVDGSAAADLTTPRAHDLGPSSSVHYRAALLSAALDRIVIYRWDTYLDICERILVENADRPAGLAITVPRGWSGAYGGATHRAADCLDTTPFPMDTIRATSGSGTIDWPSSAMVLIPCTVDVHAQLVYEGARPPWLPGLDRFDADAVFVDGACLD